MEPESSIRSVVSKVPRKLYGSSPPPCVTWDDVAGVEESGISIASSEAWMVVGIVRVGPVVVVGDGVYAGGGSFIPGGRLVAGDGFVIGLTLLLCSSGMLLRAFRSAGPLKAGVVGEMGVLRSE
jgi:hypothetical protein